MIAWAASFNLQLAATVLVLREFAAGAHRVPARGQGCTVAVFGSGGAQRRGLTVCWLECLRCST
ncbi:hypothetical protein QJS66_11470 [Kocuria rhizophila]|nr:hypothetical protein QJS66_11470 [Kocuria rhizophila]